VRERTSELAEGRSDGGNDDRARHAARVVDRPTLTAPTVLPYPPDDADFCPQLVGLAPRAERERRLTST
jgi:hypothetical protein